MNEPTAPTPTGKRYVVACFGLERERARRQPWHTACGLARGLAALGHETLLLTDAARPPELPGVRVVALRRSLAGDRRWETLAHAAATFRPERVFVTTGALALARSERLALDAPLAFVMGSPRPSIRELLRLRPGELLRERRLLLLPLINALLPGFVLRRGLRRSGADGIVYLSAAARERYARLGLPPGRLLRVQVDGPLCHGPPPEGPPFEVAYLGPPLGVRGAGLALKAFERALADGLDARLLLLLRPDAPPACTRRLLRAVARSPAGERVAVETRPLEPAELRARLTNCSAFLLPFKFPISEVPLVVLEAGLGGRPVVVLDAPGVSEHARALGGVVARSPRELPAALAEACRRPPRPPAGVDVDAWTRWDLAVADLLSEGAAAPLAGYRLLALAGVDGSGKSTLADRLAARFAAQGTPCRRAWSRFRNYLSKPLLALTRLTGHNRKEVVAGVRVGYHDFARPRALALAFLALQTVDQLLDLALRFRGRRGLLVADRCVLDTLVDLAVDTGREDLVFGRLGRFLLGRLPRPALVVVLDRSPEAIRAHRPDALADRHFERRRRLYARAAETFGLPVLANEGGVEEGAARILALARARRAR